MAAQVDAPTEPERARAELATATDVFAAAKTTLGALIRLVGVAFVQPR